MRLYSGETGIDTSDLERALELVQRHRQEPAELDFLEKTGDEMVALPQLKQKVGELRLQRVQLQHLSHI